MNLGWLLQSTQAVPVYLPYFDEVLALMRLDGGYLLDEGFPGHVEGTVLYGRYRT